MCCIPSPAKGDSGEIVLHYSEAERETAWEKVQRQYVVFLSDWRTGLGGKNELP